MKEPFKTRFRKFITLRTMQSKIFLTLIITAIILIVGTQAVLSGALTEMEEDLICSRLVSDMGYLEEIIGDGYWEKKDNVLYHGDIIIGDGTDENAYCYPFLLLQAKIGTFSYAFMKTGDEGLKWVGDDQTGYQQGHFMRVAGSTRNEDGSSIVGTYMDKQVSDVLDSEGIMYGEANVNGSFYFCLYETLLNRDGEVVGAMVVGRDVDELKQQMKRYYVGSLWVIILIILLANLATGLITLNWSRAIAKIKQYLGRIESDALPEEPLVIKGRDEFQEVGESVNLMTESLKEKQRMGAELSVATRIQANMLPSIFPAFPDRCEFDIYATMKPAKEVGGDFYDFFMLDRHNIAITIGDVSGKGVPAALFMVVAKTLIKNYALMGMSPAEVFTKTNATLCEGNEDNLFVTCWMGILNLKSGHLSYTNAGHNPPLIRLSGKNFEYMVNKPGFVLAGIDSIRYKDYEMQLSVGDRIIVYTDGVTEATSPEDELYGEKRLLDCVNNNADADPKNLVDYIHSDINEFIGEAPQFDDITVLVLDYKCVESDKDWNEKVFAASIDELGAASEFVETELKKYNCPENIIMRISISLEEIFVNITKYAYGRYTGDVKVGVGYDDDKQRIILKFTDSGMPFNPLAAKARTVFKGDSSEIFGLGLSIVKKLMDDASYEYSGDKNITTFYKNL